jgi:RNA-directed DNA polymerase
MSRNPSMHDSGESYSGIVPTKLPNESGKPPKEVAEGRSLTKENTLELNSRRTPCRESGHSGLERVRETASKDGKLKFTALLHHVSINLLRESYHSLKRKAAPGVVTRGAATQSLLSRIRSAFGCATGQ